MSGRFGFMGALLFTCSFGIAGCGGDSPPSLLGNWETKVDSVTIGVTFAGSPESGTSTTVQSTPVGGDMPTCRAENVGIGTFQVLGTSVTLTVTEAKQRTRGCSFPDSEMPTDKNPAMNFASALSGPFVMNDPQLQLGNSYPKFTRK